MGNEGSFGVSFSPGGGGSITGGAASTDGEVVLYSGIDGKTLKRSNTITGIAKLTAGVLSAATANSDYVTPINPAPAASPGYSGVPVSATNGEGAITMVFGDICYVDTSGNLKLISANALATMRGMYACVGTSAGGPSGTVAPGAAGLFIQYGYLRNDAWAWGAGGAGAFTIGTAAPIWGTVTGTAGNTCSQVAPASGKFAQLLGFPVAAKTWCFFPNLNVYEVA